MNNVFRAELLVLLLAGAAELVMRRTGQPGAETAIKHGEALFRTKACVTCHAYSGMDQPRDWEASFGRISPPTATSLHFCDGGSQNRRL